MAFRYFRELFGIRPDDYLVRGLQGRPLEALLAWMGDSFGGGEEERFKALMFPPPPQCSLCSEPLIELSNSGASGSIFYVSSDDEFIIKTVQHKEAEFLQKLLPGYYMVSRWGGSPG